MAECPKRVANLETLGAPLMGLRLEEGRGALLQAWVVRGARLAICGPPSGCASGLSC